MTQTLNEATSIRAKDRWTTALGMGLAAINVSLAIHINSGQFDLDALVVLTFGLIFAGLAILLPSSVFWERTARKGVTLVLIAGVLLNVLLSMIFSNGDREVLPGLVVIGVVSLLCLLDVPQIKHVAVACMLLAYLAMGWHDIHDYPPPEIDVLLFQQQGSAALLAGKNPYAVRWPSHYSDIQNKMFYGPGVVDNNHIITYGFPYPPLSLLLALPSYAIAGDVRYAHLTALLISAGLMAYARRGWLGTLATAMFLLVPRSLFVIQLAWTEPFLLLTFSLTIFCACRYRKAMPYALGLFFATKQYSILAFPVIVLLTGERPAWREMFWMLVKAGIVAAIVTVPIFLWNPREMWHSVVQWQFVQPFRIDALSYLVWFKYHKFHTLFDPVDGKPRIWIPFLAIVPAIAVSLWRCPRTPAGFAAAVTLISFVFFALNKQAFCNYYFFVVGAACWSIAALNARNLPAPRRRAQGFDVIAVAHKSE
jgi:hypothetical protein